MLELNRIWLTHFSIFIYFLAISYSFYRSAMSADANANGIFSFSSFQTVACRQRDPWWSCYCLCLAFDVSKTKSLQQCYQCAYVHTFQVFDIGSFFREAKTRIGMWTRLRNFELSFKPKIDFRMPLIFAMYSLMYC